MHPTSNRRHLLVATALSAALLFISACTALEDNRGSSYTTEPGAAVDRAMFVGKWDVDGERTNTANGNPGVGAIPSDIWTDLFGAGWEFKKLGVLAVDSGAGTVVGDWRFEEPNRLYIKEKKDAEEKRFEVQFIDGYMYLKEPNGQITVMERDKFFGA